MEKTAHYSGRLFHTYQKYDTEILVETRPRVVTLGVNTAQNFCWNASPKVHQIKVATMSLKLGGMSKSTRIFVEGAGQYHRNFVGAGPPFSGVESKRIKP